MIEEPYKFSDFVERYTEEGLFYALIEAMFEKTHDFDPRVLVLYVIRFVMHPALVFVACSSFLIQSGASVSSVEYLAVFILFLALYKVHRLARREIYRIRDVIPNIERLKNETYVASKLSLHVGKEYESKYDEDLEDAAFRLSKKLRQEGAEIWQVDGNHVVTDKGYFIVSHPGNAPDESEEVIGIR